MGNIKANLITLAFVLTGSTGMAAICFKDAASYEAAKQESGFPAVLSTLPVAFKRSQARPYPAAALQIRASDGKLYMEGHQVSAFTGKYESDRAMINNVCIENGVAKITVTDLATKKSYSKIVKFESDWSVSVSGALLGKTTIEDYNKVVAGFSGRSSRAAAVPVAQGNR